MEATKTKGGQDAKATVAEVEAKPKLQFFFDAVKDDKIAGWVRDPNDTRKRFVVEVRADGVLVGTTLANRARGGLARLGYEDGSYAFSFQLPPSLADGLVHIITTTLPGIPQTARGDGKVFQLTAPGNSARRLQMELGTVENGRITGWLRDPEEPKDKLVVEVKLDDEIVGTVLANVAETPSQVRRGLGKGHMFHCDLPASASDGRKHVLAVTAAGYSGPRKVLEIAKVAAKKAAPPKPVSAAPEVAAQAASEQPVAPKADAMPAAKPVPAVKEPETVPAAKPIPMAKEPQTVPSAKQAPAPKVLEAAPAQDDVKKAVENPRDIKSLQFFLDAPASGFVTGWARDRSQPEERLSVEIRIDGKPLAVVPADQFRSSLIAAGIGDARYGFSYFIPVPFLDGKPHTIAVFDAASSLEAKNSPRTFSMKPPAPPAPLEAVARRSEPTISAWTPNPDLVAAIAAQFAGKEPLSPARRKEIAALIPFEDFVAAFDLADAVPFPPLSPWEAGVAEADVRLRLAIKSVDRVAITTSLCGWALLSATPPILDAVDAEVTSALAPLASEFGLGIGRPKRAGNAKGAFIINASPGDVFHPRLFEYLGALPATIKSVSWDCSLITAAPGLTGNAVRLRPPAPLLGLVGEEMPPSYALAPGVTSLPALDSAQSVVLPEILGIRFATTKPIETGMQPVVPASAPASRSMIIVAGEGGAPMEATLRSIFVQTTTSPAQVVLALPDGKAPVKADLLAQCKVISVGSEDLSQAARWAAAASALPKCDVFAFIEAGLTFADNSGLQTLFDWAGLEGTGFVAAPVLERRRDGLLAHPQYRLGTQIKQAANALEDIGNTLPQVVPYDELRCWAISRDALSAAEVSPAGIEMGASRLGMTLTRARRANLSLGRSVQVVGPRSEGLGRDTIVLAALYPEALGLDIMRSASFPGGAIDFLGGRVRLSSQRKVDTESPGDGKPAGKALLEWQAQMRTHRSEMQNALDDAAGFLQKLETTIRKSRLLSDDL